MYLLPQLKKDTGQEAIFNFIKKGKIDESDIFKEYDGLIYTPSENRKVKTEELHLLRNNIMELAKKNGFAYRRPCLDAASVVRSGTFPHASNLLQCKPRFMF